MCICASSLSSEQRWHSRGWWLPAEREEETTRELVLQVAKRGGWGKRWNEENSVGVVFENGEEMQGLCLVADTALCFWKGFFRRKGLWGGLGTIQRRSRALFYSHFKPAMAAEDVTTLCLLCPMLESKPAEENEFAVASVQHVASYRNTVTLILCYNWRDWSWRYRE